MKNNSAIPNVGDSVVIEFTAGWAELKGKVIATPSWVGDKDCFAVLVVGSEVPLRIVSIKDVSLINGRDVNQSLNTSVKTFSITGSKGEIYTVTQDKENWSCTCLGYSFRKTCKHIAAAKEKK